MTIKRKTRLKKIFCSAVAGILLIGSLPSAPLMAQSRKEDCPICGHACCCPDVCAPLIKEMKKKKAMSCCASMNSSHRKNELQGCDSPFSTCRMGSSNSSPAMFNNESIQPPPPSEFAKIKGANPLEGAYRVFSNEFLDSGLCFLDPPTPPPRSNRYSA